MPEPLGLYIHIPFCCSKCGYCDFYSLPGCRDEEIDKYMAALAEHIKEHAPFVSKYETDTVYIGGGTPSYLGAKRLAALLGTVKKSCNLAKKAEITVEVNPESVDKKFFKAVRRAGVNRVSIGIQSANDDELKMLGRPHDFAGAKAAVEAARAAKIENISVDMMYGLPGQTVSGAAETLGKLIELSPEHISCYALKLSPGTPMGDSVPEGLPSDDETADMYEKISDMLREVGYEHYEISNFAKPGFRSRHNAKYWDMSEYLGIGAGAHSYFGGKRFSFVADTEKYISGVTGGGTVIGEHEDSGAGISDRCGEYVMLALRTSDGLNAEYFRRCFRRDFSPIAGRLEKYESAGFSERTETGWRLTEKGFFVSNSIIIDALDVLPECQKTVPEGYRRPDHEKNRKK